MLKMADQLHIMKGLEIRRDNAHEGKDVYDMEIKAVQDEIMRNLKKLNDYAQKNKTIGVCAFAQFQSMNGKKKLIREMNMNSCKRCCLRCIKKDDHIKHKYF